MINGYTVHNSVCVCVCVCVYTCMCVCYNGTVSSEKVKRRVLGGVGDGSGRERGNHVLCGLQSWLLQAVCKHFQGVTTRSFLFLLDQPINFKNHCVGF